jgi:hypothetical protein
LYVSARHSDGVTHTVDVHGATVFDVAAAAVRPLSPVSEALDVVPREVND